MAEQLSGALSVNEFLAWASISRTKFYEQVASGKIETRKLGKKTLVASIQDGTAKAEGDLSLLTRLAGMLVTFEIGFEVLPGTGGKALEVDLNPYEVAEDSALVLGE